MTTEIDAEGLAVCPFCGEHLIKTGANFIAWAHPVRSLDEAKCPGVGVHIVPGDTQAIAAWNRRASTSASEAEPVAVTMTIDREALRKRIENDPDEGEIGAGFEMFTPEAEVALERMAFAALPRWAQDELTALRAAATLPTPASDDQVEAVTDEMVGRAAVAVMKEDGCGYTINGLHVLCDDNLADGLVDGYGKALKQERCDCRVMARAALLAAMGSTKP